MLNMRPGVKVPMWSPRFKNRPEIEPPVLLRLVAAVSIFSIIGLLLYAVAVTIARTNLDPNWVGVAYVVFLHFILPFCAFFSISTNSPFSRVVIAAYVLILCFATIAGKGILGEMQIDEIYKNILAATVLVIVLTWLFRSPRMRFYYAAISNKPIPSDLVPRLAELQGQDWLSPKARATVIWFLDHMETLVLFGFIFLAIYAFARTV